MEIKVGNFYYHKTSFTVTVRKITKIDETSVHYDVVYGPQKTRFGVCKLRNFVGWITGTCEENTNYQGLGGCIYEPTYLMKNTKGEVLFRCSSRRMRHYIKKGHAIKLDDFTAQLTHDLIETRLKTLYGPKLNDFFLQEKNDKCVVCGRKDYLTRHHVIPRRHLKKLNLKYRKCLSNVLFICRNCHDVYEIIPEPEINFCPNISVETFYKFCYTWQDHFLEAMKPKYLPLGWKIIIVENFEEITSED